MFTLLLRLFVPEYVPTARNVSLEERNGLSRGHVERVFLKRTPEQYAGAVGSAVKMTTRTRSSLSHNSKT